MGSKPRDSGQMQTASAGADASAQAQAGLANQQTKYLTQAHDTLFGADGNSGELAPFMDSAKLNDANPQGVYADQYKAAVGQNAKAGANVMASVQRNLASRGFGNGPSGFGADQARKTMLDTADANSSAYQNAAGASHGEALSNFWNAINLKSGNAATATNAAVNANSSAAGTYANLYNTASTPVPSALGGIIGAGLQGAGTVGAAALCPAVGSKIRLLDGTDKLVELLVAGNVLLGIDGEGCELSAVTSFQRPTVITKLDNGQASRTTAQHAWIRSKGGYVDAQDAEGKSVLVEKDSAVVASIEDGGICDIFVLTLNGSHSYLCDGIWSLS